MPRDVIYSSACFIAFQIFREGRGDGSDVHESGGTGFLQWLFDSATEFPDVCQFSGNSSRSSHTALATFEIAVAGANVPEEPTVRDSFRDTASRQSNPALLKNDVQTGLSVLFDDTRTWHDHWEQLLNRDLQQG